MFNTLSMTLFSCKKDIVPNPKLPKINLADNVNIVARLATGYDILSLLPDAIETTLESRIDNGATK